MAFGQFLIAKPQSGNSDPVTLLKDLAKFLCGETDLANMPSFVPDVQTYIVNTVPAGWEYLREYTSGLSYSTIYAFTMRAPIFDSPGKYKYMTLGIRDSGELTYAVGDLDVLEGGHIPQNTHGTSRTALTRFRHWLQLDKTYYLNITVSPRHFFIFAQVVGTYTGPSGVLERTRFNSSWDTVDSDWSPVIVHTSSMSTSDSSNMAFRTIMSPSLRTDALTNYIGVTTWSSSHSLFNAVYNVAGVPKYFLYQPKYASRDVELGLMHPDIPIYAIGMKGSNDRAVPSNTCGASVTIGTDTYIVWSTMDYAAVTTYPLYIRKE